MHYNMLVNYNSNNQLCYTLLGDWSKLSTKYVQPDMSICVNGGGQLKIFLLLGGETQRNTSLLGEGGPFFPDVIYLYINYGVVKKNSYGE